MHEEEAPPAPMPLPPPPPTPTPAAQPRYACHQHSQHHVTPFLSWDQDYGSEICAALS